MCIHEHTRIVETRAREHRLVYRRHQCTRCGFRFSSLELPEDVIRAVGTKDMLAHAARLARTLQERSLRTKRDAVVKQLLDDKWKIAAIASQVGLSVEHTRVICRKLRETEPA